MDEEMEKDDRIFLMGEEVAQYDGAYKVSKGLLKSMGHQSLGFPSQKRLCRPLCGATMTGLKPICEMMTWNFASKPSTKS